METQNLDNKHRKFDTKSLIIGFLSGIILAVIAIVSIAFIYTSVPKSVSSWSEVEEEFLSLDETFVKEYEAMFPSDGSHSSQLDSAESSGIKAKETLEKIKEKVKYLNEYSSDNMNKNAKTDEYFDVVNKCYAKRTDIYNKYSEAVNNQLALIKLVRIENMTVKNFNDLENDVSTLLTQMQIKDVTGTISTIDSSIASLSKIKTNISNMQVLISWPSLNEYINYTNKAISALNRLKSNIQQYGFSPTNEDTSILNELIGVGKIRTSADENYYEQVRDWVYKNVTSPAKEADTITLEANQLCTEGFNIYKQLYPNSN